MHGNWKRTIVNSACQGETIENHYPCYHHFIHNLVEKTLWRLRKETCYFVYWIIGNFFSVKLGLLVIVQKGHIQSQSWPMIKCQFAYFLSTLFCFNWVAFGEEIIKHLKYYPMNPESHEDIMYNINTRSLFFLNRCYTTSHS